MEVRAYSNYTNGIFTDTVPYILDKDVSQKPRFRRIFHPSVPLHGHIVGLAKIAIKANRAGDVHYTAIAIGLLSRQQHAGHSEVKCSMEAFTDGRMGEISLKKTHLHENSFHYLGTKQKNSVPIPLGSRTICGHAARVTLNAPFRCTCHVGSTIGSHHEVTLVQPN